VVHCRDLLTIIPTQHDLIRDLLLLDAQINVIQAAAARAILERNDQIAELTGHRSEAVEQLRQLADRLQYDSTYTGPPVPRSLEQGATST